jgi:hypothetical protein
MYLHEKKMQIDLSESGFDNSHRRGKKRQYNKWNNFRDLCLQHATQTKKQKTDFFHSINVMLMKVKTRAKSTQHLNE